MKRRNRRWESSLPDLQHDHEIGALNGDNIVEPNGYISLLLRLGGKYTPFVHPKNDLRRWVKHFNKEFLELERVLVWSTFFTLHPPDDSINYFRELPYKALRAKKGTMPNNDVLKKIPYGDIENARRAAKTSCYQNLHIFEQEDLTSHGVLWHRFSVDEWANTHGIVPGDKDGSFVPMSTNAYLNEQHAHLRDVSPLGDPIYYKLASRDAISSEFWLTRGHEWHMHLNRIILERCPPALLKPIHTYLDVCPLPTLPKFRLLTKSHKRLSTVNGRWPSRPIQHSERPWFSPQDPPCNPPPPM